MHAAWSTEAATKLPVALTMPHELVKRKTMFPKQMHAKHRCILSGCSKQGESLTVRWVEQPHSVCPTALVGHIPGHNSAHQAGQQLANGQEGLAASPAAPPCH